MMEVGVGGSTKRDNIMSVGHVERPPTATSRNSSMYIIRLCNGKEFESLSFVMSHEIQPCPYLFWKFGIIYAEGGRFMIGDKERKEPALNVKIY